MGDRLRWVDWYHHEHPWTNHGSQCVYRAIDGGSGCEPFPVELGLHDRDHGEWVSDATGRTGFRPPGRQENRISQFGRAGAVFDLSGDRGPYSRLDESGLVDGDVLSGDRIFRDSIYRARDVDHGFASHDQQMV